MNHIFFHEMVFRNMIHYPYPGWLKSTWMLIGNAFEKNR
jgi:hypothetical protein